MEKKDFADALKDLHKCLKQVPGFKDEKQWDSLPSLDELATYLFKKAHELMPEGGFWMFDEYVHNWRLAYYKQVQGCYGPHFFPVQWIVDFRQTNKELADLMIITIAKVAQLYHLSIIKNEFNWNILEDPWSYFEDEAEMKTTMANYCEGVDIFAKKKKKAPIGPAIRFVRDVRRECKRNSVKDVIKKIERIQPQNELEIFIQIWLESAIPCLLNPTRIEDFYHEELIDKEHLYEYGDPIKPEHVYCFVWTYCDAVFDYHEDMINAHERETCALEPMAITEFFANKKSKMNPKMETSMSDLNMFMDLGRDIYYKKFHTFYQELRKNPDHKKSLIHILS